MKFQYWYIYSSLDFEAQVLLAPLRWTPMDESKDFSGAYYGPFRTLKEARAEVSKKIRSDIMEYRGMLKTVNGPTRKVQF